MGSKQVLALAWCVMGVALVTHAYGVWEFEQSETVKVAPNVISDHCLQCICQAEGCEKEVGKCKKVGITLSCGPFQINEAYWRDCGRPGSDWQNCTKKMTCSKTCVSQYLKRYGSRCSGKSCPPCYDYARIHDGGYLGCHKFTTLRFWDKVNDCCQKKYRGDC